MAAASTGPDKERRLQGTPMNPLLLFWAKLGSAVWPEQYHPVICHLIDVAAVTRTLWTAALRPAVRRWTASHLGLDDAACGSWLAFWAGAHDIGKVSPGFQHRDARTEALRDQLEPPPLRFNFDVG